MEFREKVKKIAVLQIRSVEDFLERVRILGLNFVPGINKEQTDVQVILHRRDFVALGFQLPGKLRNPSILGNLGLLIDQSTGEYEQIYRRGPKREKHGIGLCRKPGDKNRKGNDNEKNQGQDGSVPHAEQENRHHRERIAPENARTLRAARLGEKRAENHERNDGKHSRYGKRGIRPEHEKCGYGGQSHPEIHETLYRLTGREILEGETEKKRAADKNQRVEQDVPDNRVQSTLVRGLRVSAASHDIQKKLFN